MLAPKNACSAFYVFALYISIDGLMEKFVQLLPASLIISSSELQMLDISLGQGKSLILQL